MEHSAKNGERKKGEGSGKSPGNEVDELPMQERKSDGLQWGCISSTRKPARRTCWQFNSLIDSWSIRILHFREIAIPRIQELVHCSSFLSLSKSNLAPGPPSLLMTQHEKSADRNFVRCHAVKVKVVTLERALQLPQQKRKHFPDCWKWPQEKKTIRGNHLRRIQGSCEGRNWKFLRKK